MPCLAQVPEDNHAGVLLTVMAGAPQGSAGLQVTDNGCGGPIQPLLQRSCAVPLENIALVEKGLLTFLDSSFLETRVSQESISEDVVSAGAPPLGSEQQRLQKLQNSVRRASVLAGTVSGKRLGP